MENKNARHLTLRAGHLLGLFILLVAALALLASTPNSPGLADGGAFPTDTPTYTPLPTFTSTPTPTFTPLPTFTPTNTITPIPLIPTQGSFLIVPPSTPTPSQGVPLLCWPFAIAFIIIVVIVSTVLVRRTQQSTFSP